MFIGGRYRKLGGQWVGTLLVLALLYGCLGALKAGAQCLMLGEKSPNGRFHYDYDLSDFSHGLSGPNGALFRGTMPVVRLPNQILVADDGSYVVAIGDDWIWCLNSSGVLVFSQALPPELAFSSAVEMGLCRSSGSLWLRSARGKFFRWDASPKSPTSQSSPTAPVSPGRIEACRERPVDLVGFARLLNWAAQDRFYSDGQRRIWSAEQLTSLIRRDYFQDKGVDLPLAGRVLGPSDLPVLWQRVDKGDGHALAIILEIDPESAVGPLLQRLPEAAYQPAAIKFFSRVRCPAAVAGLAELPKGLGASRALAFQTGVELSGDDDPSRWKGWLSGQKISQHLHDPQNPDSLLWMAGSRPFAEWGRRLARQPKLLRMLELPAAECHLFRGQLLLRSRQSQGRSILTDLASGRVLHSTQIDVDGETRGATTVELENHQLVARTPWGPQQLTHDSERAEISEFLLSPSGRWALLENHKQRQLFDLCEHRQWTLEHSAFAFQPDESGLLATQGRYALETGQPRWQGFPQQGPGDRLASPTFAARSHRSPDGNRWLNKGKLHDVRDGSVIQLDSATCAETNWESAHWSDDSRWFALSPGYASPYEIFDAKGRLQRSVSGLAFPFGCLAFGRQPLGAERNSADQSGRLAYISNPGNSIWGLDIVSGRTVFQLPLQQLVQELYFSEDGRYLVVCGADRVRVYDLCAQPPSSEPQDPQLLAQLWTGRKIVNGQGRDLELADYQRLRAQWLDQQATAWDQSDELLAITPKSSSLPGAVFSWIAVTLAAVFFVKRPSRHL